MSKVFRLSKKSLHNMDGTDPELQIVFIEAIKDSPIDFGVPSDGGVRTAARQHEMYLDPDIKTNCDGYGQVSNHQIEEGEKFGKALDFYAYVDGRASWADHHLSMVAAVILSTAKRLKREGRIGIDVTWGGTFGKSTNFTGWDKPHTEVVT